MSGFLASSTFDTGGVATTGIVLAKPAGITSGDFLLTHILQRGDSHTITPPAGWSLVRQSAYVVGSDAGVTFWTYSKIAGGSEPASYTFTSSNSQYHSAVLTAYFGVKGVAASAGFSGLSSASRTIDAPTLSGTAGEILVCAFGVDGGTSGVVTFTPPAGMTEQADAGAYSTGSTATDVALVATGATGTKTATYADSFASRPSGAHSLTLVTNVAPNAPTLTSPANSSTIDRDVTQRFGVVASDPDAGDSQSALSIRYRLGAGAWVTVADATPNPYHDFAPATFAAGAYEWQAQTTDAQGLQGPLSASSFFTAGDTPGVPSITAPVSGSTVVSSATLSWSVAGQTNYQVRRVADAAGAADTATVYYDSGDVVDASTRSVTVAFPVNSRWEHLQVRVKTAGLWSAWADCRVQVSYTPPMAPTIVATTDPSTATIRVAVTNPTPTGGAPVTSYNDIYVSSPLDVEYRAASLVAPNSTWVWWTPAATRAYTIRAVAVGSNGTTASQVLDTVVVDGGAPTTIYTTIHDGGMP